MIVYFIRTEKNQLDNFEAFRMLINKKKNTESLSRVFKEMIDLLRDKDRITHLSNEYKSHFLSGTIKWQMAYDIAVNLLTREMGSEKLNYAYTLIHYFFYYLTLPSQFKCTFFLQHGLTVDYNNEFKSDIVKNQQYIVCKKNQELLSTYILSGNRIDDRFEIFINQAANIYNINLVGEKSSNDLFIIQFSDSKT